MGEVRLRISGVLLRATFLRGAALTRLGMRPVIICYKAGALRMPIPTPAPLPNSPSGGAPF